MDKVINIAICDDDANDLKQSREIAESVLLDKNINYKIDEFNNPYELIDVSEIYDIIFLDVEMEILDGIEVGKRIKERNKDCVIFFVTNHGRYIDDAFNVRPLRFWEKPLDVYRVNYGIESALKEINSLKRRIVIDENSGEIVISNIVYIHAENKATRFIMTKGDFIVKESYKSVFGKLNKYDEFIEVCRGCCINLRYLRGHSKNKITCGYGEKEYVLDISRRKYENFCTAFMKWIGGSI